MNKFYIMVLFVMGFTVAKVTFAQDSQSDLVEFLNSETSKKNGLPFSQAVRVGNMLLLSGEIGVDKSQGKLVKGGIKAEAEQTMLNIKNTLVSHGYSMKNIVKCTVMLADISEWQAFNEVYTTFFETPYPARSAFGANGLALGAKVEVECIAAV